MMLIQVHFLRSKEERFIEPVFRKCKREAKGIQEQWKRIIVYNRFHQLGVIEKNTDEGIYGELNSDRSWIGEEAPIQVAEKEEIKTGRQGFAATLTGR